MLDLDLDSTIKKKVERLFNNCLLFYIVLLRIVAFDGGEWKFSIFWIIYCQIVIVAVVSPLFLYYSKRIKILLINYLGSIFWCVSFCFYQYSPLDIGIPNININQKGGGGGGGGGGGEEKGGGGNGGDGSKQMVNVYNLFTNGIDI